MRTFAVSSRGQLGSLAHAHEYMVAHNGACRLMPPIAVAGVQPGRIWDLQRLGFLGAAVLGAVWQAGDHTETLKLALAEIDDS